MGARFAAPVTDAAQARALPLPDPERDLGYVLATVRAASNELAGRAPLLGSLYATNPEPIILVGQDRKPGALRCAGAPSRTGVGRHRVGKCPPTDKDCRSWICSIRLAHAASVSSCSECRYSCCSQGICLGTRRHQVEDDKKRDECRPAELKPPTHVPVVAIR